MLEQEKVEAIKRIEFEADNTAIEMGKQLVETPVLDRIINRYDAEKGSLLSILFDIQEQQGLLSRETIEHVSKRLDVSLLRVYQVARFHREFKLEETPAEGNENRTTGKRLREDYLKKFSK